MLRFILPSILWTIVVITASLLPSSDMNLTEIQFKHFDKVVHFSMYLLLSLFWITGLKRQNKSRSLRKKAFLISVGGAFFLSFILEVIQEYFTETRHFEGLDLLANGIGCIFGLILFKIIYPNYRKT